MAIARIKTKRTYTLELNEAEAIVLRDILSRIAGPHDGPRGEVNAIAHALDEADVPHVEQSIDHSRCDIEFTSHTTRL